MPTTSQEISSEKSLLPLLKDVIQISAGEDHTCALLKDGTVKCY